jgi:hypothetical protein
MPICMVFAPNQLIEPRIIQNIIEYVRTWSVISLTHGLDGIKKIRKNLICLEFKLT